MPLQDTPPFNRNTEEYFPQSLGYILANQNVNDQISNNSKFLIFFCNPVLAYFFKKSFYPLNADHFNASQIGHGGDLSIYSDKEKASFLIHLSRTSHKTLLVIGAQAELLNEIQFIQDTFNEPYSISCISDQSNLVDRLDSESIFLKEINLLGFQRQHIQYPNEHVNYFRTGEFRTSASSFDPPLRRSDFIFFDLNAIRASESPGNFEKNPSGLFSEEASTISRMAGMSERAKIYFISAWNEENDLEGITAKLVAQMAWYYWEGCHLKQLDQNVNRSMLTQYSVELKNLDYIIKFYKSENTGKWWFEEPLLDNEISNQLIPCTYEEYLATAKDQIPSRILEMINA